MSPTVGRPLTVTGGAESVSAHLEDLEAVAAEFRAAADEVDEVVAFATAWAVLQAPSYPPPVWCAAEFALGPLIGPASRARLAADALRDSAAGLAAAAMRYLLGDRAVFGPGVVDEITGLLGSAAGLFSAVADVTSTTVATRSPVAGLQQFAIDEPGLVNTLVWSVLSNDLVAEIAGSYPDGDPRVRDLGTDPSGRTPPAGLADLIEHLARRNETKPGEVSVSFVTGADGRRRAVVDIPGTKSWDAGATADVTSMSTNARAVVGARSTYERGVLRAMADSGIRPDEEVMLVGHSEGGAVAVTAARDALQSKRFTVTHVVTAGSPIGRTVGELPESVRVLALENRADVVPNLDGAGNPARPNVTTASFEVDHDDIVQNHALRESYAVGAAQCDASDDPSVRAFVDSADGFLSGTSELTHAYLITREY